MLSKDKMVALAIACLTGVALGIGIMIVVAVCLTLTGNDFEIIPYAYGASNEKTVFHTPKFTLVFEGPDVRGSGSGTPQPST
jgi:hypothetical protein